MALNMWTLLLLILTQSYEVSARANPWALPTPRAVGDEYMINGWTPKPTPAPRRRGVQGGVSKNQLFGRDIVSVCGYIDGNVNQPYTCDAGTECALNGGYWQCCDLVTGSVINQGLCTDYVTCVNYGGASSSHFTGSLPYGISSTYYCPSANPTCWSAFLIEADFSTYVSYGCWTDTYVETIYQNLISQQPSTSSGTTLNGLVGSATPSPSNLPSSIVGPAVSSNSPSSTSGPPTSTPNTPSTTTGPSFSIPQGGHTTGSGGSGTSSPSPTHTGKSTNVGAIAGGVVGGVAVVGLVGAAIGYLILRKRRQRVEPMQEISPGYYAPSPGQHAPSQNY